MIGTAWRMYNKAGREQGVGDASRATDFTGDGTWCYSDIANEATHKRGVIKYLTWLSWAFSVFLIEKYKIVNSKENINFYVGFSSSWLTSICTLYP